MTETSNDDRLSPAIRSLASKMQRELEDGNTLYDVMKSVGGNFFTKSYIDQIEAWHKAGRDIDSFIRIQVS
jgi:type II secretory pathway component PulF